MGVFVPFCIIQGGKSLYAFTKTRAYTDKSYIMVYMLVKSNESPSHTLEDLTWTPVSVIQTSGYAELRSADELLDHNCAFDVDTGVFTLFHKSVGGSSSAAGMQYFPPGTSGGNPSPPTNALLGSGTWRNVTFPPDYKWIMSSRSRLWNYKDPQSNKTQLMHVYNNRTDVYVATLDPVTMTMIQGPSWTSDQVPGWTPTMAKGFSPRSINANSHSFYILALNDTAWAWDRPSLYQFPINSANLTSPSSETPTLRTLNGTTTQCSGLSGDYYLFNFRENPLMVCGRNSSTITLVNGTGTEPTMLPGMTGTGVNEWYVGVFEVVDIPPAVPYLIYQDTKRNFFSVPLSGQSAGAKFYPKKNMTVTENYGDNLPPWITLAPDTPLSDWGSGRSKDDGSKSSTGAIVGGVCAVVVVVIAVFGFLYYRRRRQWNNHQGSDKAKSNSSDSSSPTAAAGATGPHLTQSWNQEPMQQVQPPPLQYLQVDDQDQGPTQQQHNYDHSNNGFVTQPSVTSSGSQPSYSSYPSASLPTPTVPVRTRPLTEQHGFP
ncbi:hypothetical protein B0O80DRAFT_486605 [Mortierella sp. GBAus27b]|nr:hypothetical protein B0O80DRAFT_486605 [Mortierella sp. GBAus27b]